MTGFWSIGFAQDHSAESGLDTTVHSNDATHDTSHETAGTHGEGGHGCECHEHEEAGFDPKLTAFHHIGDANVFHVWGDFYAPLPCILYAPDQGLSFFMSSKFGIGEHGTGEKAVDRYVLYDGWVMRVPDTKFPVGEVEIDCINHQVVEVEEKGKKKEKDVYEVVYKGECYALDKKTTWDAGLLGGGVTSFYDFSITKNVFTMLLMFILLFWMFSSVAKAYKTRSGQAPKGLQSFIEPIFTFIRDEVAIPFLGHKYERYLPYLMSIFFFILGLNLIGQLPIFPGSGNVTGNLAVTAALALFTFFVVNLSGNKHYWEHTLWMPGVPALIKILILTPVEVMGLFLRPLTLMLRLFANITAGHVVIIIFVGLIFIFGQSGANLGGGIIGILMSIPLTLFMMAIELLVAFIQAFVFCMLTASYISAAIEEPHHH
ncbi:MAG: F0F1 ATP synthase subunit A [Saprospiraceae bacterium]